MIIGIDVDGIITRYAFCNPSIRLPWWLFYLLVSAVSLLKPNKATVVKMQDLKSKGYKIVIVTARPIQLAQLTERWLRLHHIPFDNIFCVGFGKGTKERKLRVIENEKIEIFVDNNNRLIEFLRSRSIIVANNIGHFN